jgi:hypothetical protein
MTRRVLNLLNALSLLLCVAVVALWVRSAWVPGLFLHRTLDEKGRRTGDVSAWTWRGSLVVQVGRLEEPQAGRDAVEEPAPGPAEFTRWARNAPYVPLDPAAARFAGFGLASYGYTFGPSVGAYRPWVVNNRVVMVPWYAVVLFTAAGPLLRLRSALTARRRAKRGWCARCGYDLTGNESGACPECGGAAT